MGLLANSHESLTHPTTLLSKVKPAEVEPYTCIFPVASGSSSITSSPPAVCDLSPPTTHPCGPVCSWPLLTHQAAGFSGGVLPAEPPHPTLGLLSPPISSSTQPTLLHRVDSASLDQGARNSQRVIKASFTKNESGLTGPPLQPFRAGRQTISRFHPRKGRDNRHKGHF